MPESLDVLFLVPPMRPVLRPLDVVHIFFKHSQGTKNIISVHLGLLSIAAYLRNEGFSCGYYDLGHFAGKPNLVGTVSGLLNRYNPKIVALTSYTSNFNSTLDTIKIIKDIDPGILICVGGPHVTFLDKYSIKESKNRIDIIVRGEGERTMLDIVKYYLRRSSIDSIEDEVRGITTVRRRTDDQKLLTNEELSLFPPLALDLIPQRERNNYIYIPLTATRGCAYKCVFCINPIFWSQNVRFRPPDKVVEEVKIAEKLFGKKILVEFSDTILPINMRHFESLADLYIKSTNTPIKMALTRANLTDDRRLRIMKRLVQEGGYISIGVENCNPTILQNMGKPTWEIQLEALKKLKKFQLNSIPTWMVGFCGETTKIQYQNVEMLDYLNRKELIQSAILNIWIPIPGSRPFQTPEKYGVKIHTKNWDFYDRAVYPPPYSLFDPSTGETTLTEAQVWAYFISMIAMQNKWSRERRGTGMIQITQEMREILKNPGLLFYSPAGEAHNTIYEDAFVEYYGLFNFLRKKKKKKSMINKLSN